MYKKFRSLRGLEIAMTGACSAPRAELTRRIRQKGGIVGSQAHVTRTTDILVRGVSSNWKYGDHGVKEERAADLVRNGAQLSMIYAEDLEQLLEGNEIKESRYIGDTRVDWLRGQAAAASRRSSETGRKKKRHNPPSGATERETRMSARTEQEFLRAELFGDRQSADCALCGEKLPVTLLVAAHIKPREYCKRSEKQDPNVVMSACLLGCDALYERGLVTVSEDGRVTCATKTSRSRAVASKLGKLKNRKCSAHHSDTESYFAWHRDHRFSGGLGESRQARAQK